MRFRRFAHGFVPRLLAWTLAAAALAPFAPAGAAEPADAEDAAAPADAAAPITAEATAAFWRGDVGDLERQYLELKRGKPLREDGVSKLELFRMGVNAVIGTNVKRSEPYLRELEALTLQWAGEHPASALAHVLHARVLVAHAWSHRGTGYNNTVTPEGAKQFEAYLRRAAEYLKAHADTALSDSYGHLVLVDIGRGMGWSRDAILTVADAGLARDPNDIDLYFHTLPSYLPKWGGDPRSLDKYIRGVAERTKGEQGMGMYARLYGQAATEQFSHSLFEDSLADWRLMKQGYEDLLARYPDSTRRNRFAYMACMAKDRPTLVALLAELGPKVDASAWGANGERTLEGCQRWAKET